jgi:hypothetical protein
MKSWLFVLIVFCALSLTSCAPANTLPLTETYIIPDFGFSIDYPEGWLAGNDSTDPVTWIFQDEEDYTKRHQGNQQQLIGIRVSLDHRTLEWLNLVLGLKGNPTLNDLFDLNIHEISHMVNPNIEETTLFGVDALKSEFYGAEEQWYISYAGFIDDEAFLLMVSSPTEEELENFKPTWDAMLESIKSVEE